MLSAAEQEDLAALGRAVRYRPGHVLFREGEPCGSVVVLTSGRAKVHVTAPSGRQVIVAVKGNGDLLGEIGAFSGLPYSATATALEELHAVRVAPSRFVEFVEERPRTALAVLRSVAADLRAAGSDHVLREGSVTTRVAARLASLVGRSAEHEGEALAVPLRLTQDDLAAWVSASREAVNRAIAELRGAGLVSTRRGVVTVIDPAGLAARAAG